MYVKALRLSGFKSFADPTVLEFDRGVNVIVGPNGSGKSNIADALSWVLGSQAPSTMRGASMEDVIFAGSDSRSRLGIAEVELTLDNSSRALPLDLAEITIGRSADRSGASEYTINGAPCRLLDIAELLSDTGIGRSLHTMVGQGQLDAVLQAQPEERRSFIEEAAQIGKFRRRKDRSLRRIERVDDNLVRLNDVLVELRRSLRPLKRQASAAAVYSELLAEHRHLRQRLAATEVAHLNEDAARHDPTAESHRASLLSDELESVRARLGDAALRWEALADAAEKSQEVAHRLGRATDRLEGLVRIAGERAAAIGARLAAETEEGYRERIRLLEASERRWRSELETLDAAGAAAAQGVERARASAAEVVARLRAAETALVTARAAETAGAEGVVRAEGQRSAARSSLESMVQRASAARTRRSRAEEDAFRAGAQTAALEAEVAAHAAERDAAERARQEAETRLGEAREELEGMRARLGSGQTGVAAARARLETLEEISTLFSDRPEVIERLAGLIEDARHALSLASATEEEAKVLLAEGRARLEDLAARLADHDGRRARLDRRAAAASRKLEEARRRAENEVLRAAALADELTRWDEDISAAQQALIHQESALPELIAARDDAAKSVAAAQLELETLQREAAAANSAVSAAELEARAAHERALAARLRLEEAEAGIGDARSSLAGIADVRASLTAAKTRVERAASLASWATSRARMWAEESQRRAAGAREQAREGQRHLEQLRQRERELAGGLEKAAEKRSEAEVKRAQVSARTDAICERAMEEWGLSAEDLARLEVLEGDAESEARDRLLALEQQMRRLGTVNPRAAEEHAELAEREKFLEDQIADLESSKADLLKIVAQVDATIVDVFGSAFEDVAREFEQVFQRLFPGGNGNILLTNPGDILTSGIEIEARPPGKNVKKLSLLSGGERSLVALAFLLAIFRSRPSPFYLLDEVEAALDDINLLRFLGLIAELRNDAQVLIVTHQKRTMEAAGVLYGVSMSKDGVSRVVAKRMEEVPV